MPVRPRTLSALLAATAVAFAITTSPAHAQVPDRGSWVTPPNDFVDPDVCADWGFVVTGTEWDDGHWEVTFNRDGSFKEAIVHNHLHVVVHANGKTMYEDDTWTELIRNGTFTLLGDWTHQSVGGHILPQDAGLLRFDRDGNVVRVAGPHPSLEGGSFCPSLLPAA